MKIGIFDSGLGGLIIAKAIMAALPQYDYAYLGDTARLPYGSRSNAKVLEFTRECVDFLFRKCNCQLIIIACNTASQAALRKLQQEYLPVNFPDRRILGVIIPTVEECHADKVGLLATNSTVASGVYDEELRKINSAINLYSVSAPLLVPLIENQGDEFAPEVLKKYLSEFNEIETIILGCTHYAHYKNLIAQQLGSNVKIISQDEIIPEKTKDYLHRHPEIESLLSKDGTRRFYVTDLTEGYESFARSLFTKEINIERADVQNA
jgi:glutamate racemase